LFLEKFLRTDANHGAAKTKIIFWKGDFFFYTLFVR